MVVPLVSPRMMSRLPWALNGYVEWFACTWMICWVQVIPAPRSTTRRWPSWGSLSRSENGRMAPIREYCGANIDKFPDGTLKLHHLPEEDQAYDHIQTLWSWVRTRQQGYLYTQGFAWCFAVARSPARSAVAWSKQPWKQTDCWSSRRRTTMLDWPLHLYDFQKFASWQPSMLPLAVDLMAPLKVDISGDVGTQANCGGWGGLLPHFGLEIAEALPGVLCRQKLKLPLLTAQSLLAGTLSTWRSRTWPWPSSWKRSLRWDLRWWLMPRPCMTAIIVKAWLHQWRIEESDQPWNQSGQGTDAVPERQPWLGFFWEAVGRWPHKAVDPSVFEW